MTRALLIGALLALAACGVDGPPSKPPGGIPDDGIAGVGVVGEV